ncbi:MAG: hydrogenase nickel incorporation protein HypB [Bacteroidota bacterium]
MSRTNKAARGTFQVHDMSVNLLKANDYVADTIRRKMDEHNIFLVNMTSSAGSGKTALLEEVAKRLRDKLNMAVLGGDLETERDSERIRAHGVTALQIVTGGICHLEAQMIMQALDQLNLEEIDLLFIENVGNLVCPASFDLGEDIRVTLIATTEGDDKPKKYPKMFLTSDLMLVSKIDLLPYLPFSLEAVTKDALEVNKDLDVLTVSSTNGDGIDQFCDYLLGEMERKKVHQAAV